MFFDDRENKRKPKPKATAVEIAKKSRDDRTQHKIVEAKCVRIQTCWRRYSLSRKFTANLHKEIDKKLVDIRKVSAVLALKNVKFVTPPEVCMDITRKLFVLLRYCTKITGAISLTLFGCLNTLLIPNFAENGSKNMISDYMEQQAKLTDTSNIKLWMISKLIVLCLEIMTGGYQDGLSVTGEYPPNKCKAIGLNCGLLVLGLSTSTSMSLLSRAQGELGIEARKVHDNYMMVLLSSMYKMKLFEHCYRKLTLLTSALVKVVSSDNSSSGSSTLKNIARTESVDNVVEFMMQVLSSLRYCTGKDSSGKISGRWFNMMARTVFTIPLLLHTMSNKSKDKLVNWEYFSVLLTSLFQMDTEQYPSILQDLNKELQYLYTLNNISIVNTQILNWNILPIAVYSTSSQCSSLTLSHWICGNISSLSAVLSSHIGHRVDMADTNYYLSRDELTSYLRLLTTYLKGSYIEGVLLCKPGMLWTNSSSGSSKTMLSAEAIPYYYYEQIMLLYSTNFHRCLIDVILAPVSAVVESSDTQLVIVHHSNKPNSKIEKDIKDSLQSTAFNMTRQQLFQQETTLVKSVSSWNSKIRSYMKDKLSSITSVFGGNNSVNSSSSAVNSSSSSSSSNLSNSMSQISSKLRSPNSSVGGCSLQSELVSALFEFWSFIIPHAVNSPMDSYGWKLVTNLAFATTSNTTLEDSIENKSLVAKLWIILLQYDFVSLSESTIVECNAKIGKKIAFDILVVILVLLRIMLIAMDDDEIYSAGVPLNLYSYFQLIHCINGIAFNTYLQQSLTDSIKETGELPTNVVNGLILKVVVTVLKDLHTRWARKPFCSVQLWEIISSSGNNHPTVIVEYNHSNLATQCLFDLKQRTGFGESLFRTIPFTINFQDRMQTFREWLDKERLSIQGGAGLSNNSFFGGAVSNERSKGIIVKIRHSNLIADGITAMNKISGTSIKDRIVVRYVNDFGQEEMGIDLGGLFKDFWTEFSERMFNPAYGLFTTTNTSEQLLYPNPSSYSILIATGSCANKQEVDDLYVFLGRILGKALFENITVQPQFTHFFLSYINGKYNFLNIIDDLKTLDVELYKNLMFLKSYEGDIADLALTFSISDNDIGLQKEIDLIPNGSKIDVTTANKFKYIQLVAKYYLHDRIMQQTGAFFHGLYQVVHPEMLSMFCAPELQVLISGTMTGISLGDLKAHCQYAGGFTGFDRNIQQFWKVLEEFSDVEMSLLVRFVTSCARPPSLGFKALQPPFTIQRIDCTDDSRLPTASTCFNILKLPTYSTSAVLKQKLIFAIKSGAGFDLS